MDIRNYNDARRFVGSWAGQSRAEYAIRNAAESQRRCAQYAANLGRPQEYIDHSRAAAYLALEYRDQFVKTTMEG